MKYAQATSGIAQPSDLKKSFSVLKTVNGNAKHTSRRNVDYETTAVPVAALFNQLFSRKSKVRQKVAIFAQTFTAVRSIWNHAFSAPVQRDG